MSIHNVYQIMFELIPNIYYSIFETIQKLFSQTNDFVSFCRPHPHKEKTDMF